MTTVNGVKTVFIGFGSLQETSATARGWVIACAAAPLSATAAWASTAKGYGGGIWQGAAGLVADAEGFIYAMTGNGTFDGEVDFAESFVKLGYVPPTPAAAGSLSVTDWWTPFSDAMRTDPEAGPEIEELPLASNYRAATGAMGGDPWSDQDLGSAGPLLVESFQAVIGAGKDGIAYVLHQNDMGKTAIGDLNNPAQNYEKLTAPPYLLHLLPSRSQRGPTGHQDAQRLVRQSDSPSPRQFRALG